VVEGGLFVAVLAEVEVAEVLVVHVGVGLEHIQVFRLAALL